MELQDGYILYKPQEEEVQRVDHWEVWIGLPSFLRFEEVPARDEHLTGLRAQTAHTHVWVTPGARCEIMADAKAYLSALGKRTSLGMEFYVWPAGRPDIVAFAEDYAAQKLQMLERKKKKKVGQ